MKAIVTTLPGVLVLEPRTFGDERGYFYESYNRRAFAEATGLDPEFVQDNHSRSVRGVLRGLHYQLPPKAQGKLVRVTQGEVYDVAVDLRPASPCYGHWEAFRLSADNRRQLWIPPGFAHGFLTLSDTAEFLYKCTDYYDPALERCLRWNDPALAIAWPLAGLPILSGKDATGEFFGRSDLPD